jgi:hypothetical protein
MIIVLLFCDVWFIMGLYYERPHRLLIIFSLFFVVAKRNYEAKKRRGLYASLFNLLGYIGRPSRIENLHKATPSWVQSI